MSDARNDPHAEYTRRLSARRAAADRHERLHRTIGNLRLLVFVLAAAAAWIAYRHDLSWPWLAPPAVGFISLVAWHARVARALARARRAIAFYERGLARLEDHWAGTGETGERFADSHHPYAADLDLFGRGSLFELLSTARTRSGEETLAAWLLAPAAPDEIEARQAAVEELRGRLDLREEIALLGADVRSAVDPDALVAWSNAPPVEVPRHTAPIAAALASLASASLVYWGISDAGKPAAAAALLFEGLFALRFRRRVFAIIQAVERPGRDLALLSELLERLSAESFAAPRLRELQSRLETTGLSPGRQIARLRRLVTILDSRRNLIFAPLAAVLLAGTQLALAIERWRTRFGAALPRWLAAVGEFEALAALAAYAYEHPADPFPSLEPGGARFDAEDLGHPLIPEARSVRNDVRLGDEARLLVVSGSNMSGKSTLLRTVGTNAVLALAGAPVRARRLRLSALAVGASIRTVDSLQDGSSRFYAEITRLRQLADLAKGTPPLLFLLDELLGGTNSHDRRIGAEAVLRNLVDLGAIGLATTHDLALAEIAATLAPRAANVHFQDHLENGRIAFDYRLHPGVVRKSNALELMRSVGLDV
ncbi:MAG: DNA mismatch repair protein MutS [Acidobacteria bacterium]|nr:MAG: DNA mismatch repair protein MutS [Acidobacteriota bacterium]